MNFNFGFKKSYLKKNNFENEDQINDFLQDYTLEKGKV